MYQSHEKPLKESDWDPNKEINSKYFGIANTKIYIEKMLEFYSMISKMKTTAIRHSNIYGPFDKYDLEKSHVFGATITKVMTAKNEIIVWGSGDEKRDVLHVDDLMNFASMKLQLPPPDNKCFRKKNPSRAANRNQIKKNPIFAKFLRGNGETPNTIKKGIRNWM